MRDERSTLLPRQQDRAAAVAGSEGVVMRNAVASAKVVDDVGSHAGSGTTAFLGLATTMMGACILTLPSTLEAVGVVPGLLVFLIAGYVTYQSFEIICMCCDATGEYSYEAMSSRLFGATGVWVIRTLTLILLFGSIVMYMVIAMDLFEPFFVGTLSRSSIGLFFTVAAIPLCLPETIHELRYTNSLVILCIVYIVVALCVRTVHQDQEFVASIQPDPTNQFQCMIAAIAYVLPIISLSFACQLNVPRAYEEIDDKRSMHKVHKSLVGSGMFFYVAFALLGFACFHGHPPSDILNGFPSDDAVINGARLCLGVSMLLKTPMSFQPLRQVFELCCLGHNRESLPFRLAFTIIFMALAHGLSLTSRNLGVVMSLLGALAGNLLSISAPGMFLWQVSNGYSSEYNTSHHRALAVSMACIGVVFSVVSVLYQIYSLIES